MLKQEPRRKLTHGPRELQEPEESVAGRRIFTTVCGKNEADGGIGLFHMGGDSQ